MNLLFISFTPPFHTQSRTPNGRIPSIPSETTLPCEFISGFHHYLVRYTYRLSTRKTDLPCRSRFRNSILGGPHKSFRRSYRLTSLDLTLSVSCLLNSTFIRLVFRKIWEHSWKPTLTTVPFRKLLLFGSSLDYIGCKIVLTKSRYNFYLISPPFPSCS